METIKYIKQKLSSTKTNKDTKQQVNQQEMLDTIDSTIKVLSHYRKSIIKGRIYDTKKYAIDRRQNDIASGFINIEKDSIANAIKSLKELRESITSSRIADMFLQWENDEVQTK